MSGEGKEETYKSEETKVLRERTRILRLFQRFCTETKEEEEERKRVDLEATYEARRKQSEAFQQKKYQYEKRLMEELGSGRREEPRPQPPTFELSQQERTQRFKEDSQRRTDYLITFIQKKMGLEAARKFNELIEKSRTPNKKFYYTQINADFDCKTKESGSSDPSPPDATLNSYRFELRKCPHTAKNQRKLKMDREERRLFEILKSSNPLKMLEDEGAIECCQFWINYKAVKVDEQVMKWRKELYPMLLATPPPTERKEERRKRHAEYRSNIKKCLALYGPAIEEYLTYQKGREEKRRERRLFRYYRKRLETATEAERRAKQDRNNAFLRDRMRKLKKGIYPSSYASRLEGNLNSKLDEMKKRKQNKSPQPPRYFCEGARRSSRIASRRSEKPPPTQPLKEELHESGWGSSTPPIPYGNEGSGFPASSTLFLRPQLKEEKEELDSLPEEEVEMDLALLPTTQHILKQEDYDILAPTKDPLS